MLRGELRLATGTPLRGQRIRLELPGGGERAITTDLNGRFEEDELPDGLGVLVVAERRHEVELPPPGGTSDVVIDLTGGTTLLGTVTEDGRPVAYAEIVAWTEGDGAVEVFALTDSFGRFELPPVLPGVLEVEVRAPGSREPWAASFDVPTRPSTVSRSSCRPDG